MVIANRLMRCSNTACRWSQMTSRCQFQIRSVPGSSTGQACRAKKRNFSRPRSRISFFSFCGCNSALLPVRCGAIADSLKRFYVLIGQRLQGRVALHLHMVGHIDLGFVAVFWHECLSMEDQEGVAILAYRALIAAQVID